MKKLNTAILLILSILVFSGCASVYRPIHPPTVNYTAHDLRDGIGLSYKYDVLLEKGNKKYAKREDRTGIKIIAVRITNNTDTTLNIARDIVFYSGQNQVIPLDHNVIKNSIKQSVPAYLLYMLLTPLKLYVADGVSVQTHSIGYVLGPGITIGNMAVAGTSNGNFQRELINYNILNNDLKRGETVFGIIGIRDAGYNPITVGLRK